MAKYTKELHARLRELHQQASPTPWTVIPYEYPESWHTGQGISESIKTPAGNIEQMDCGHCDRGVQAPRQADLELLTEARNALPALLDEIERLNTALQTAKAEGWEKAILKAGTHLNKIAFEWLLENNPYKENQ